MSTVLSVKVSRDSVALTTTADAPEKYIRRGQKFRPQFRKRQGTTYKVCSEDLVLGSDPATGKTSALGNNCLRWLSYSNLCCCAGTVHCLSTSGNEIIPLNFWKYFEMCSFCNSSFFFPKVVTVPILQTAPFWILNKILNSEIKFWIHWSNCSMETLAGMKLHALCCQWKNVAGNKEA